MADESIERKLETLDLEGVDILVFTVPASQAHRAREEMQAFAKQARRALSRNPNAEGVAIMAMPPGSSLQALSENGDDRSLWSLGLKRLDRIREYIDGSIRQWRRKLHEAENHRVGDSVGVEMGDYQKAVTYLEALQQFRISMLGEMLPEDPSPAQ